MCPQVLAKKANSGLLFTESQRFGEGFKFCLFEGDVYFLCPSFGAGMRRLASRMSFSVARDRPSGAIAWRIRIHCALGSASAGRGGWGLRALTGRGEGHAQVPHPLSSGSAGAGRCLEPQCAGEEGTPASEEVYRDGGGLRGGCGGRNDKHWNRVCRFGKETFIMGLLSLVFYLRQIIHDLFQHV